jgi:hypothetical protein
MIKKYFTIFFLTVAQTLFLGHSIIPHQHDDHQNHFHEDSDFHHHGDSSDTNGNENGLFFLFCNFNHAENSTDLLENTNGSSVEKASKSYKFHFFQPFSFKTLSKVIQRQKDPPQNVLFNNFYFSLPLALRGPPTSFG